MVANSISDTASSCIASVAEASFLPENEDNNMLNEIDIYELPLCILNVACRNGISGSLNIPKRLPEFLENGAKISRDWTGLAELIGLNYSTIQSIAKSGDPTADVLDMWENMNKSKPTIGKLLGHLKTMKRYDVIEDTEPSILRDFSEHIKALEGDLNETYDACICFDASEDSYVKELCEKLKLRFNQKFILRSTNNMSVLQDFMIQLVILHKKCSKFILVCTPEFLQSQMYKEIIIFVKKVSSKPVEEYVIPILYRPCVLPHNLRHIFRMDINRTVFGKSLEKKLGRAITTVILSRKFAGRKYGMSDNLPFDFDDDDMSDSGRSGSTTSITSSMKERKERLKLQRRLAILLRRKERTNIIDISPVGMKDFSMFHLSYSNAWY